MSLLKAMSPFLLVKGVTVKKRCHSTDCHQTPLKMFSRTLLINADVSRIALICLSHPLLSNPDRNAFIEGFFNSHTAKTKQCTTSVIKVNKYELPICKQPIQYLSSPTCLSLCCTNDNIDNSLSNRAIWYVFGI